MEIPSLAVAISALLAGLVILFFGSKTNIKVFSLSFFLTFITYMVFTLLPLEVFDRQNINRMGLISQCICIIVIVLAARQNK